MSKRGGRERARESESESESESDLLVSSPFLMAA
jgi:hypothetical protein